MSNKYKYTFLYLGFIVILFLIVFGINELRDKNILLQQEVLLKQAQTHFEEQVNTRGWSAAYGGVYVFPTNGLKPNPYLLNNTLETSTGETLVKINPAWMTRQLSERLDTNDFHFRITSLMPINPDNEADAFETRALKFFEKSENKEYFEIKEAKYFRYMGALVTVKTCLPCHEHQGYKLGDIRGGISISINTDNYQEIVKYIQSRALGIQILFFILLISIVFLIRKQIANNENLEKEVLLQTQEIQRAKKLLQEVLDTDHSFLMVADANEIILTNKTMLDFFNVRSLEEFKSKHEHISDAFVHQENPEFLSTYMDGEHWISYLNREQDIQKLKVLMAKDNKNRCFEVHSKELTIKNENFHIIIFDDITDSLHEISSLKEKASKDALTGLFNKGKFNDVISKEIALAQTTLTSLSIIFLDIDHFKVVNDTYGHDAGDYVLKELAKILNSTVRKGDFVGRWGGEEFVITLQVTTAEQALILAENIRKNVEKFDFLSGGKQTISLGITQYQENDNEKSLLKRVDEALYEAKSTGRNKSVIKKVNFE